MSNPKKVNSLGYTREQMDCFMVGGVCSAIVSIVFISFVIAVGSIQKQKTWVTNCSNVFQTGTQNCETAKKAIDALYENETPDLLLPST